MAYDVFHDPLAPDDPPDNSTVGISNPPNYIELPTGNNHADATNDPEPSSNEPTNKLASPTALTYQFNVAQLAAQTAYNNARLNLERDQFKFMSGMEKDKLALEKAKQAFYKSIQTAQLTGEFNGQPTWQKTYQEAGLTGMYNGQATQAAKEEQDKTALGLLNIYAGLRGPRNAFQYARTLAGTPQGLRDILGAAGGRYNMPSVGGGDQTVPLQRMDLSSLWGDALSGQMGGFTPNPVLNQNLTGQYQPGHRGNYIPLPQSGGGSTPQPSVISPPGSQAPTDMWNYQPNGQGSYTVFPPGQAAPANNGQFSTPLPATSSEATSGANLYSSSTLPLPNQWDPKNVGNMGSYQKDLMLAAYEDQGNDPGAVWDQYQASLPKVAGPATGRVTGF